MKRERAIALAVSILLAVLLFRSIFGGESTSPRQVPVTIQLDQPFYPVYFGAGDGRQLVPEFRQGLGTVEQRLADLQAGPLFPGLIAVLPKEARVLGHHQQGDILFVNFTHQLVDNHPGGSTGEIITVYGIVNTLVGVAGIERVQIFVENELLTTLAGHLDLAEPLGRDDSILGSLKI